MARLSFSKKISIFMETVFVVVIGMNVTFLGDLILLILQYFNDYKKIDINLIHMVIMITVPLINISSGFINWLIYKLYNIAKKYNFYMLFADIITLAFFYLQVYILLYSYKLFSKKFILIINTIFILLILVLFVFWDYALIHKLNSLRNINYRDIIIEKNKIRIDIKINILLSLCCVIIIFLDCIISYKHLPFLLQLLFCLFWVYKWIGHGKRNNLAQITTSDYTYDED